ncbi:unnamed protein product [Malassezia sympodialis ATCC 42132]|uniref:uncharacterized protein n=1 Tax=Malassezia sympodialis (strain ATCC 42132) TaxID=1230383 RepID=UPI0002C2C584|nr:uncharacterized protein MSY001_3276 [Malassezia sympodialis ATCC 42132]CCV00571.1 unnamed protein product [Malassezia sympodialis ATCC 42132]|eukprot:XP_018741757.1 uncharacterized protein MSY001_3276 [Malassezia sympodialis ATCC 42132]
MAGQRGRVGLHRAQKCLGVQAGVPDFAPVPGFDGAHQGARVLKYSPNGVRLAMAMDGTVRIYDVQEHSVVLKHELPLPKAVELAFSPRGTYLMTWERPVKTESGAWTKNLSVWDAATGAQLVQFERRQIEGWELQFTDREDYCVRQGNNELQVWAPQHFANGSVARLPVEHMQSFNLGPGAQPAMAVFTPEKNGAPAFVRVYALASVLQGGATPAAQKSFFKADKVTIKWNAAGSSLLVMTSTDHDQTGKSYYGETNLYMLSARGDFDCRVSLDKEGPIHDFAWNPNSREFIVLYGYMPAKAVVFSYRVNMICELGTQPRNLIAYNPQGRLFCLAGFGNLAGTVDVWDRERLADGKLCTFDASNSSVLEWSPDGQFLLTGTLSPRLRVENGVKIWHCSGQLVHVDMVDEMYAAGWRPQRFAAVPEFPKSLPAAPAPSAAAAAILAKKQAASKPVGAYRPPSARQSGASTSDYLRRDLSDAPSAPYVPPGAAGRKSRKVPGAPDRAAPKPTMGAADIGANHGEAGAVEKKLRNLTKKLKAIEQLKERRDRGETLEQTQLQKIDTEADIRRELATLQ